MSLRKNLAVALFLFFSTASLSQNIDSVNIRKIFDESLANGKAYGWLDYLTNKIGGRLSGSPQAALAVEWASKAMKEAGADRVFLQDCMVPHWVRGEKEKGVIGEGKKNGQEVPVCALGGSIATPDAGISAAVVEVKSFDELKTLGRKKYRRQNSFLQPANGSQKN